MTRTVRSRRAETASQPLYARVLRLRNLAPSGLLCFVFLEGAVVLGVLLSLAELVSWWGVLVLPITVALMVKFNDLVAGTFTPTSATTEPATARASVLRPATPSTGFSPQPASNATFSAQPSGHSAFSAQPSGHAAFSAQPAGHAAFSAQPSGHAAFSAQPAGHSALSLGRPSAHPGSFSPARSTGYAAAFPHAQSGYDSGADGDHRSAQQGIPESSGQVYAPPGVTPGAGPARADYGTPQVTAAGTPHGIAAGTPYGIAAEESVARPPAVPNPVRRPWADQLDVRQQIARQAAARRYE
ncbi:hypothetical protein [Actinoplanes sp. GCM10030250]|uniref:hypothetical protein n=1 Tax=Actinoplanes sp. GCM10030250 TaxID=3273376 RepID=UPI00362232CF